VLADGSGPKFLVDGKRELQLLTAPDVSPPMNRRWKSKNKMSTGMEPRMLMAIIWFHS
jgi:hypothetical protein